MTKKKFLNLFINFYFKESKKKTKHSKIGTSHSDSWSSIPASLLSSANSSKTLPRGYNSAIVAHSACKISRWNSWRNMNSAAYSKTRLRAVPFIALTLDLARDHISSTPLVCTPHSGSECLKIGQKGKKMKSSLV